MKLPVIQAIKDYFHFTNDGFRVTTSLDVTGSLLENGEQVALLAEIPTFTKSTDANGWTVYDYGTWKEYHQILTGNPPSIPSGGGWSSPSLSLPVGVSSINDVFLAVAGVTSFSEIDVRWLSPTTLAVRLYNNHGSALDPSSYRADFFLKDK